MPAIVLTPEAWRLAVLLTAAAAAVAAVAAVRGQVGVTVVVSALALVLLLATDDTYRLRGRAVRSSRSADRDRVLVFATTFLVATLLTRRAGTRSRAAR